MHLFFRACLTFHSLLKLSSSILLKRARAAMFSVSLLCQTIPGVSISNNYYFRETAAVAWRMKWKKWGIRRATEYRTTSADIDIPLLPFQWSYITSGSLPRYWQLGSAEKLFGRFPKWLFLASLKTEVSYGLLLNGGTGLSYTSSRRDCL